MEMTEEGTGRSLGLSRLAGLVQERDDRALPSRRDVLVDGFGTEGVERAGHGEPLVALQKNHSELGWVRTNAVLPTEGDARRQPARACFDVDLSEVHREAREMDDLAGSERAATELFPPDPEGAPLPACHARVPHLISRPVEGPFDPPRRHGSTREN